MPTKIVNIPLYILKNLRPDYLVGWLHVPVEIKASTTEADQRTQEFRDMAEAQSMFTFEEGDPSLRYDYKPKKSHLRLVAVDGKIIDPDFQ